MKNLSLALIAFFLISTIAFAQKKEKAEPVEIKEEVAENYFYGSPVTVFMGTFELGYEHQFRNQNSVMVSGGATLLNGFGTKRQGIASELHYRVNMNKHPQKYLHDGLNNFTFFAPYIHASALDISEPPVNDLFLFGGSVNNSSKSLSTSVSSVSGGLLMGVRIASLSSRFVFCVYGGGGVKYSIVTGNQAFAEMFRVGYTGIVPKAGCQIGISF